jgi:DNA-binding NtrC family response regulator
MKKILVAGEQDPVREELSLALIDEGYDVVTARSGAECLAAADGGDFDLVLLAMRFADMNGIDVLQSLRKSQPDTTVIMMTAHGDIESTRRALSLGAFDFIHRPVKSRAVVSIIKTALEIRCLRREFQQIIYKNKERYGYHNLIGKSEALQGVLEVLARVATNDAATILIEGARRREEPRGQVPALQRPAGLPALRGDQLRLHPPHLARIGAFWLRGRRLHRRQAAEKGPYRAGPWGHRLPG